MKLFGSLVRASECTGKSLDYADGIAGLVIGDAREKEIVVNAVSDVDVAIHLAATVGIEPSMY